MNLFDFLVLILYVVTVGTIVIFIYRILFPNVVIAEQPVISWWPWSVTSYNYWPYWSGRGVRQESGTRQESETRQESGTKQEILNRPWGGAGRGANAGGFHH